MSESGAQPLVSLGNSVGGNKVDTAALNADAATGATFGLNAAAYGFVWNGASWDRVRAITTVKAQNAVNVNAETTVWTPAGGKKFRLMGVQLAASVAGNIIFRDNTAGTIIAIVPSAAGGAGVYVSFGNGILSAAANNVLTAQGPGASTLSGTIFGCEE